MNPQAPRDPLAICPAERIPLLELFSEMLAEMNQRVNLVSRESIDERWVRHILHSLCLGLRGFPVGARVVDWGTGGGLPCIPLAIVFPDVEFVGVDAVGKKVMAVRAMVRRLGLDNVDVVRSRAEEWGGRAEYSVSRATAPLSLLWAWHMRVADRTGRPAGVAGSVAGDGNWPPGLICLKGGDLSEEIDHLRADHPDADAEVFPLADLVGISEFQEKHVVVVTLDRA